MTTIAWDGKTLASDSQTDTLGLRGSGTKLFRLDDGSLYGICGSESRGYQCMTHWKYRTNPLPEFPGESAGIIIRPDGQCYMVEGDANTFVPIEGRHACGTGRDFAIAAMECGLSAPDAIRLASKFDVSTGGEVQTMVFEEPEPVAPLREVLKRQFEPFGPPDWVAASMRPSHNNPHAAQRDFMKNGLCNAAPEGFAYEITAIFDTETKVIKGRLPYADSIQEKEIQP